MKQTDNPAEALLRVRGLKKYFQLYAGFTIKKKGIVRAVDGISFDVMPGETLGLVGESGCGKTSTGRCILRLIEPTAGSVVFRGVDIMTLKGKALKDYRRHMQIVFQDPYSSLNPRMKVRSIIGEPFLVHKVCRGKELLREVYSLLEMVGLDRSSIGRYPHEFSGGQRQRIGIARALALRPRFLVADEPVSALDVSVQAQIINLLTTLQAKLGLTLLFISHDLNIVRLISDRIAVMYMGKIVELAPSDAIYSEPKHPYTRLLLESVPRVGEKIKPGSPDEQAVLRAFSDRPEGCAFAARCPAVMDACRAEEPDLQSLREGWQVACHLFNRKKRS